MQQQATMLSTSRQPRSRRSRQQTSWMRMMRVATVCVAGMSLLTNHNPIISVLASCVPGNFRTRLEDCPLEFISTQDGDQVTLQWVPYELKLPLLVVQNTQTQVWQHENSDLDAQASIVSNGFIRFRTRTIRNLGSTARIPAPVIYLDKGSNVKVNLWNTISGQSPSNLIYRVNMHTHGLHIGPEEDDSTVVIGPGQTHLYDYNIASNHAGGTHWYHPHINTLGELHVGGGAAGMLIVRDAADETEIPKVLMDMPEQLLVIQFIWPKRLLTVASGEAEACCGANKRTYINDEQYKILSDQGDDVAEDVPDNAFYYLVNGFVQPMLTLTANKWTRLRIMHTSNGHDAILKVEGADCKVMLLAKDGVYTPDGPRADTPGTPTPFRLTASTRMDIAIKCPPLTPGVPVWVTATTSSWDTIRFQPVPIIQLETAASTSADTFDTFAFKPCLPSYLSNLLDGVTVQMTVDLAVTPFNINGPSWLGFVSHPMLVRMPLGSVHEWNMRNPHHAFHMHINHFMLVDTIDHWNQEGDWVDTIENINGNTKFRFKTMTYPGRVTMHCHNLDHADEGSMAQAWIDDSTDSVLGAQLKRDIPWGEECNAVVAARCDDQNCQRSPTPKPTFKVGEVSDTQAPTRRPTIIPPPRCQTQGECLRFIVGGCNRGRRSVCAQWKRLSGCDKTIDIPFPDACAYHAAANGAVVSTQPSSLFWQAWSTHGFCTSVDAAAAEKIARFAVRDYSDCSGTYQGTTMRRRGVTSCGANTAGTLCDQASYPNTYYDQNAQYWALSYDWIRNPAGNWVDRTTGGLPTLPTPCAWEVKVSACAANSPTKMPTATPGSPALVNRCEAQGDCLRFVVGGCSQGRRQVCAQWKRIEGCDKTIDLPYPDACAYHTDSNGNVVSNEPSSLFWQAWSASSFCTSADKIARFAVRGYSSCSGTYEGKSMRGTSTTRCAVSTGGGTTCDQASYPEAYYEQNAQHWAESYNWIQNAAGGWIDRDTGGLPTLPNPCAWEVHVASCT